MKEQLRIYHKTDDRDFFLKKCELEFELAKALFKVNRIDYDEFEKRIDAIQARIDNMIRMV